MIGYSFEFDLTGSNNRIDCNSQWKISIQSPILYAERQEIFLQEICNGIRTFKVFSDKFYRSSFLRFIWLPILYPQGRALEGKLFSWMFGVKKLFQGGKGEGIFFMHRSFSIPW